MQNNPFSVFRDAMNNIHMDFFAAARSAIETRGGEIMTETSGHVPADFDFSRAEWLFKVDGYVFILNASPRFGYFDLQAHEFEGRGRSLGTGLQDFDRIFNIIRAFLAMNPLVQENQTKFVS